MHIILILLVIAGGMGLSVEAGLLGPLGAEVGGVQHIQRGNGADVSADAVFQPPQQSLIFCAAFMAPVGRRARPGLRHHSHHCHACDRHCHDDDRHSGRPGF